MAFPNDLTPERLRDWAKEHLIYEVTTLVYATVELGNLPTERTARENTLLESFGVHSRCLDHFLWRDRIDKQPRDAFAIDFCAPGDWERARGELAQTALEDVRRRKRFGREIMHLTYDRIDGEGENKKWPCGEATLEIAVALKEFASIALADRLHEDTREFLLTLAGSLSPKSDTPADLVPKTPIHMLVGATAMDPQSFHLVTGGTVNFSDIRAGGERD